jgi:hypothetical protein
MLNQRVAFLMVLCVNGTPSGLDHAGPTHHPGFRAPPLKVNTPLAIRARNPHNSINVNAAPQQAILPKGNREQQ